MDIASGVISQICRSGIVLGVVCIVVSGCGGGPTEKVPDKNQQATISGKVTLDGSKPAPLDSEITFTCPEVGANASGKVDAMGSFTARSIDKSVGIPAGRYQVSIRPAPPPQPKMGTKEYEAAMMSGGSMKKEEVKSDIPSKFHSFDTSDIKLEIAPGPNKIDLDLSKF